MPLWCCCFFWVSLYFIFFILVHNKALIEVINVLRMMSFAMKSKLKLTASKITVLNYNQSSFQWHNLQINKTSTSFLEMVHLMAPITFFMSRSRLTSHLKPLRLLSIHLKLVNLIISLPKPLRHILGVVSFVLWGKGAWLLRFGLLEVDELKSVDKKMH